ncbi:hypothetical protein VTN77DRAFT_8118 [Rasamsonia byssochlamydoides]|uniref:uncharacterized protein n=1 Tax=Rasamsonia byssochlamydoides TaxID=89139 RepID=UPI0037423DA3
MIDPSPDENKKTTMTPIHGAGVSATAPSSRLLRALFASLAEDSRRWTLTRHLRSDNPADINGELRGIATFQPLPSTPTASTNTNKSTGVGAGGSFKDLLYREEGEVPGTVRGMAGLRWSKKYIWRLNDSSVNESGTPAGDDTKDGHDRTGISVWFVKVAPSGKDRDRQQQQQPDEADYLFHEFEFDDDVAANARSDLQSDKDKDAETIFVTAPTPPLPPPATAPSTTILTARGNHLCVKDMYRTAYAFRIRPETGEVLSWASRHVVKGPKKNQEIVNLYEREGWEG